MADPRPSPGALARQRRLALGLQAALLGVEHRVWEIEEKPRESDVAVQADTQTISDAVQTVWNAYKELRKRGTAGLAGVPSWLAPRPAGPAAQPWHPAGLRLLQDRLDGAAGPWSEIGPLLASKPAFFLLDQLTVQWREDSAPADSPDEPEEEDQLQVTVLFPVIHTKTGYGFLVEVILRAAGPGEGQILVPEGVRLTRKFRESMQAGYKAGLALARELGVSDQLGKQWETCEIIEVRGVPAGYTLDDRSAGIPTAVALVGRLLGLPAVATLVSGAVSEDGAVTHLPSAEEFESKSLAALDHELDLLASVPGEHLSSVCARQWPETWDQAVTDTARRALRELHHRIRLVTSVGTDTTVTGRKFQLVRTFVVDKILQRLEAGAPTVVVGGPRASSKTTSARQAALEWHERHEVPVIELDLNAGILPDQAELLRILTLARNAAQVGAGDQALVILEDLLPHEDAMNLDAVLPEAAQASETTIIAVCLYAGGPRWICDQIATVPSIRRPPEVRAFITEFVKLNGFGGPDEHLIGLNQRTAAGDLWWLVERLMEGNPLLAGSAAGESLALAATAALLPPDEAASDPPADPLSRETRQSDAIRWAYAHRIQRGLAPEHLKLLRGVAAASLLHVRVPEILLPELPREALLQVGAQQDYAGRWFIARSAPCRALLTAVGYPREDPSAREWQQTAASQYQALSAMLGPHLGTYHPATIGFASALLAGANAIEPSLHRRLLILLTPLLTEHVNVDAPPALVAYSLLAAGDDFPLENRQRLFETLLKVIMMTGWAAMSARSAGVCLRAIRSHRDHASDGLLQPYRDVLDMIGRDVAKVLSRSDPGLGVFFVHELGPFFEEATEREIVPLAIRATTQCKPHRLEHYEAAVRLLDATLRYASDRPAPIIEKFTRAPGIRRLLEAEQHDDAGLVLAHVALETMLGLNLEHDQTTYQRIGTLVDAALARRRSTANSVARGLMMLERADIGVARQVVRQCNISSWIRTYILDGSDSKVIPWQAAQLIRILGKIDGPTCIDALYETDGSTPRSMVMDALVESVKAMGDLKGVGHVISAVTSVDTFWGPGGSSSASAVLCVRLNDFVDAALDTEIRGSVILATVTALVGADVPEEILRGLLERCVDVVQTEAEDNDRDHAPRLALLLAGHEAVGSQFISMLEPQLKDSLLLSRLAGSQSVETRGLYLDLARGLRRMRRPQFRENFLDNDWLRESMTGLRTMNVASALRTLRFFSLALRDAGVDFRNEALLRMVDDDPKAWARRLRRLYDPAHLAQALHLLQNLAPAFARECLGQLDTLNRPASLFTSRQPIVTQFPATAGKPEESASAKPTPAWIARLEQRKKEQREAESRQLHGMVRLIQRQFIKPSQAIELINAVGAIDAEARQNIGIALSRSDSWGKRAKALRDIDSLTHLGALLRMMARASLNLPVEVLNQLFRAWRPQVSQFRSPAVAHGMICGFAASGPHGTEIARQWAAGLNLEQVARRVSRGLPGDLKIAPKLIDALGEWGPEGSAEEIASALPADAALRMPMAAASVLWTVQMRDPASIRFHAQAVADAIAAQTQIWYVRDPEDHWRELGWLIRAARKLIGGDIVDHAAVRAAVENGCRRREVISWVRGCLGDLPDDEDWYWSDEPPATWVRAARLVVRSDLGATEATAADEISDILGAIEPRWQLELLRCASADGKLRESFTEANQGFLTKLGEWYLEVGSPVGRQLIEAVSS